MKTIGVIFLALLSIVCAGKAFCEDDYLVGPQDILAIRVIEHQQFDTTTVVNPSGKIQMPIIGAVDVNGLTATQIREKITALLAEDYLANPLVTVDVKEPISQEYYVYGEVAKPGEYIMHQEMTVLKAITTAGGLNPYASHKIRIIRQGEDKSPPIDVNLNDIISGKKKDFPIKDGDVIVVNERIF